MSSLKARVLFLALCSCFAVVPAQAQFAVIDVGTIAQLVQQVNTMRQQLTTARNQLTQAQQQLDSMTGGRGMERLLAGTVRNYLPPDWAELERAAQAGGGYGALAADIQGAIHANAVLTAQDAAALSEPDRLQLERSRRSVAVAQVTMRQALAATSARFAAIQELINAIPAAEDQKAILDLQARISAEQGMLANDQTKINVLFQSAQAEEWARKQRIREQAIAGIGSLRRLPRMGL